MTKNSGDWEGLQGHDDDPAQFKHKAWVHEGGGSIYIYVQIGSMSCISSWFRGYRPDSGVVKFGR